MVESRLGAVVVAAPTERPVEALANCYKMPSGELWFCSYGEPVKIRFGESDYFRVQFQHSGTGATQVGQQLIPVAANQGCVSSADATLSFGSGFQQLAWRVNRGVLARKLAAITGSPVSRSFEFEPALDLSLPRARALLGILHSIVHSITVSPAETNRFLLGELEQSLMVALLTNGRHTGSHLLGPESAAAAPWQVRMVEEYIEAHLDKPFAIEMVLPLTGCSARTIYREFQRTRGYSPMEFSKQRRLLKARDMLQNPSVFRSVTEVALACGFSDLSHFSRDFAREFGENPSAARRSGGIVKLQRDS